MWRNFIYLIPLLGTAVVADVTESCPGYKFSNVQQTQGTLTADLTLARSPCNVYGNDIENLKLIVEYQTDSRLHVKIYDEDETVYQIPASVLETPSGQPQSSSNQSDLIFSYSEAPFSFAVQRRSDGETLFNTSGSNLIFESQYVRLRTSLPLNPYLYGLGENSDSFRLEVNNYKRTLWNTGQAFLPTNQPLYGSHPIYIEMRNGQAHGVFLSNSNGMDININQTSDNTQYLEYNTIGGVLDFYFLAGPAPADVARQYAGVVGTPVQQSYWTYGFHQCKYGYQDIMTSAEVVYNYSQAGIPLETMWNDIDYMDLRRTWTVDPDRFPMEKVQEFVTYLHEHQQHYIVMVDPPVSINDSTSYNNGVDAGVFIQYDNGTEFLAVMWPGAVTMVDYFHPNSQNFWSSQIGSFFSDSNGIGVDGIWIDMNDPANFCQYPCNDPVSQAVQMSDPPQPPPVRTSWDPLPGFPADFQPPGASKFRRDTTAGNMTGLPDRDLINPPYSIGHLPPLLSANTLWGDLYHYGGYAEYDTHNLFASQMLSHTRQGLLDRRPNERPFIITRSTFAGDGRKGGHWTGDNASWWSHYLLSIFQHMEFASIFQMPMVGSDVCGFNDDTTETLCARWAMLGAWYPFYRNHADIQSGFQEFYRWPLVTEVAKKAIATRFQLMDYFYTSFYQQTLDGSPTTITPLFFQYPEDSNTLEIDYQFFYGPSILVSPVTVENATDATFYLPEDTFYDFWTAEKMPETGTNVYYDNVTYMDIPVHIRGGSILPLRTNADQVNTTTQLREQDFELIIALDDNGKAKGNLYLDDGISTNSASSFMELTYDNGQLVVNGTFGYQTNVTMQSATIYGTNDTTPPIYQLNKALNSAWTADLSSSNNTVRSG